jgi:two-component system NtrC family sensor kinase
MIVLALARLMFHVEHRVCRPGCQSRGWVKPPDRRDDDPGEPEVCAMAPDAVSQHSERQLLGRLAHLEGELGSLDRQLARTNRLASLGTITGIIAHELNNLLTPMISYAQLALKDPEDRELVHKALQRTLDGGERAAEIISSVLGFSRTANGGDQADVRAVVDEALRCLARDPKKDGFEFTVDIAAGCEASIAPVLLVQILMNLILNAYQAMTKGKGRITIKAWTDGDTYIRVIDNGCGIEAELLPRIFDPFVTYRNRPNATDGGTGLGLTACKRLVEEVGGTISVESTVDEGTTFEIRLPARSRTQPGAGSPLPSPQNRQDVA